MEPVRVAAGAALLLLLLAPAAFSEKGRSEGSYVDAAGNGTPGRSLSSHALLWDGAPYTPAGVVFHSRFLALVSEANFAQDRDTLKSLRDGGVQDIWIDPGRGLTSCGAADLQRLVDLVESDGFRYRLAIRERTADPFERLTLPRSIRFRFLKPPSRQAVLPLDRCRARRETRPLRAGRF